MNRETKFRGIAPSDNKFVFGWLTEDLPNTTAYYLECPQRIHWFPETGGEANSPVKKGTVGQFTGFHDKKNDKEIYGGDIMVDCRDKTEQEKRLRTVISEVREAMTGNKEFLHPDGTFNGGSEKIYNSYYLEHQERLLVDRVENSLKDLLDLHIGVVELCEYDDGEGYCDQKHYGWRVRGLGKKYKYNVTLPDAIEIKEIIGNVHENPELIKELLY